MSLPFRKNKTHVKDRNNWYGGRTYTGVVYLNTNAQIQTMASSNDIVRLMKAEKAMGRCASQIPNAAC
jgi:hypothetical protein